MSISIFSLQCQYIVKHTGNKNKENHQLGYIALMHHQTHRANAKRKVCEAAQSRKDTDHACMHVELRTEKGCTYRVVKQRSVYTSSAPEQKITCWFPEVESKEQSGFLHSLRKHSYICPFCSREPSDGNSGRDEVTTVNSRLADTPLVRTLAITDKIQIPGYRGLTGNDSRYYGLSLIRTLNEVPSVSNTARVDCTKLQNCAMNRVFINFCSANFSAWFTSSCPK